MKLIDNFRQGTAKLPWVSLLVFLVVFAVFLRSVQNGFVNYDDPAYITDNPHVQTALSWQAISWAFTTSYAGNWHPLTWLSHMLDWQLFGMKSWGHHLTSVLLHALNATLLWLVLWRMSGSAWRSLFVGLFFGLHPLRVQSVAWVSERKDLLSTMFMLLTIWAYVRYVQCSQIPQERKQTMPRGAEVGSSRHFPASFFYLLAVLLFSFALMSKPMTVTLPFVLLLLDYWPLQRFQTATNPPTPRRADSGKYDRSSSTTWRLIREKIPFFGLAAAASAITFAVQQNVGAVRTMVSFPLRLRLENAVIAYCRYLGKLFYPVKLAAFYPYLHAWRAWQVFMATALVVLLTIFTLALRRRYRYLLVGWLWFIGTLIPVIGLVQVGAQSIADRYTYIPLIGIFILLVWGANDLVRNRRNVQLRVCGLALVTIICWAGLTWWQIGFWRDSETLFRRSLAVTDDNPLARLNLGVALAVKNSPEAVAQMQSALSLVPGDPDLERTVAKALIIFGHPQEAIEPLQASLQVEPDRADAHLLLGRALASTGRLDDSLADYREAIRLNPKLADAHLYLGFALGGKKQFDEAAAQFQEFLSLNPGSAEGHDWLGRALGEAGRFDEAISQFQQALGLQPDFAEAYNHWGIVLRRQRRPDEAVRQFQHALRLKPNYADAHVNLGVELYNQGLSDEAIKEFQRALKLDPNHALARTNLDALLEQKRAGPNQ